MFAIREFFSALKARETFSPRSNSGLLIGLLVGVPGAFVAVSACVLFDSPEQGSAALLWRIALATGLAYPLLLSVLFAAFTTRRNRRSRRMRELLEELRLEVSQLESTNNDIRDLDRRKDEFLGTVTHELKTPLVTIRGYADMLRSGRLGPVSARQGQAVEVMRKSARRLQEQIDRLLAFNSHRGYLGELQWEKLPLARLINDLEERHLAVAESKGVRLYMDRPPSPVVLWGDRERLLEVLENLLSNAIKFTASGGEVRIRFGEPRGSHLPVDVQDDGCGIPEHAHQHIFERFRQAHGGVRKQFGGSGLGLAIVRGNLEAHGCAIRVESEEGKGSRFLFTLPLAIEKNED